MNLYTSTASVVPFSTDAFLDAGQVGAEALGLIELLRAGFEVPDGFCVTMDAYHRFLETLVIPECVTEGDLARIQCLILETPIPEAIAHDIIREYARIGGPVTVRASGIQSDLSQASFARHSPTLRGVEGTTLLLDAIRSCWASAWTEPVWNYCLSQGLDFIEEPVGVIIQSLIPAEVVGIMSTVNPSAGLQDEMVVEACWGLGDALVSERVEPDRFILDGKTGIAKETHSGGEDTQPLALDAERLAALCDVGNRVMQHFGAPQEIEFAYAVDRFYLVQARPITTLSFNGIPGEWTTADFLDGGVFAHMGTPYLCSLYELIWEHSMPSYFKTIKLLRRDQRDIAWSQVFFGRPYWNVGEVKRSLCAVPGFNEREFDLDLGIPPTYDGDGVAIPVSQKLILRALPARMSLNRDYKKRIKINQMLVDDFPALEARYDALDPAMPFGELLNTYRSLILKDYFSVESSYFMTLSNASSARLEFKEAFEKATKDTKETIELLDLMVGLKDVPHLKPLNDLWEIARLIKDDEAAYRVLLEEDSERVLDALPTPWGARIREFCQTYRYHSTSELDLRVPNWDEDPSFVTQCLKSLLTTPEGLDPISVNQNQHSVYLAERAKLEKLSTRRDVLEKLDMVRSYGWWRETMRDLSTRMYYQIRRWTRIMAQRLVEKSFLGDEEDVFFLTYQEVIVLAEGRLAPKEAQCLITQRKAYNMSFRNFKTPNEVGARYAQFPKGAAGGAIRGVPGSSGRVEGTVRIIRRISEFSRLGPGDIMVTTFTDPGWTPLFGMIRAVVTETGGFLGHAAVVSREYGIPAVMAVPDATLRLKEGDRVVVDGNKGHVEVLA